MRTTDGFDDDDDAEEGASACIEGPSTESAVSRDTAREARRCRGTLAVAEASRWAARASVDTRDGASEEEAAEDEEDDVAESSEAVGWTGVWVKKSKRARTSEGE